jgi:hypothetical protein
MPNCDYETDTRSQICIHHIIPRELNGTDDKYNKIICCPNCHSKIFIENATAGIHSVKADNSIILMRWVQSTSGKLLEYKTMDNEIQYYEI